MASAMKAAASSLASRTFHIKTHPAVTSLPERREVLRVLSEFGSIEMFKSLKYESGVTNAFIGIFENENARNQAIEASPLNYSLIIEEAVDPALHAGENIATGPQNSRHVNKYRTQSRTVEYELRISPSSYDHAASIKRSPLYGPFDPVPRNRSHVAADLAARIPDSVGKAGMCDWVTDSIGAAGSRGRSKGGAVAWERSGAAVKSVPWRILDKAKADKDAKIKSLTKDLKAG